MTVFFDNKYRNSADKFNQLSPCPGEEIELPDGRKLLILNWEPKGHVDSLDEVGIEVTIKAIIK